MEALENHHSNGLSDGKQDFVTVVSVGSLEEPLGKPQNDVSQGYVTVLTIGDDTSTNDRTEEVLVYRLPGERLGFGLKFEGGTKPSEFVKRLFIQSCAPDSPASRVRSSWGCLVEGDEVLEIDSLPVKTMTRIDCVRCLKDSNVVIKLLIKHVVNEEEREENEDLPLVISAEKKRAQPPPPPPVPPRKVPRKMSRDKVEEQQKAVPPVPPVRNTHDLNGVKNPSPRNHSSRLMQPRQSPEVAKKDRMLSDDSIGPPDAEVYVDLLSQESPFYMSESDDTGSSISTVVDRFASFPTTTTSSFAGSLPSTPTAVQRKIDLTLIQNPFDNLTSKLISLQSMEQNADIIEPLIEKVVQLKDGLPANFQDAPLSYGDEDVKIVEAAIKSAIGSEENVAGTDLRIEADSEATESVAHKPLSTKNADDINGVAKAGRRRPPPPPPPPRSKQPVTKEVNNNNDDDECLENLPRLVDFVPKSSRSDSYETLRRFLENEQRVADNQHCPEIRAEQWKDDVDYERSMPAWDDGMGLYAFNWIPSSPLATIGEDEEESIDLQGSRSPTLSAPIVIVEHADDFSRDECDTGEVAEKVIEPEITEPLHRNPKQTHTVSAINATPSRANDKLDQSITPDVETMDPPSINTRQPPDGHEFPDYEEKTLITKPAPTYPNIMPRTFALTKDRQQSNNSVRNMIAKFSTSLDEHVPDGESLETSQKGLSKSVMNINLIQSSSFNHKAPSVNSHNRSSMDLSHNLPKSRTDFTPSTLHKRSQSLIDISDNSDRWSAIAEHQRKSFSKLKGLIIPEYSDAEENVPVVDLPEIRSVTTVNSYMLPIAEDNKETMPHLQLSMRPLNSSTPSLTAPIWNTESSKTIPKYSPAFKRKSLQVCPTKIESEKPVKGNLSSPVDEEYRLPVTLLNDAPKSLESITSPTRSDCSFEYISSSPELKNSSLKLASDSRQRQKIEAGRSEDESDNDSAVSSSQSSYISRNSPPPPPPESPNPTVNEAIEQPRCKYDSDADCTNRRLLKPQSVEAINRKNILASAKCRSGRDLKVGSPLVSRKLDEQPEADNAETGRRLSATVAPALPEVEKEAKPKKSEEKASHVNGLPPLKLTPRESNQFEARTPRFLSKNNKSASVTDLRRNFEKNSSVPLSAPVKIAPISFNKSPVTSPAPVPAKRNSLPTLNQPSTKTLNTVDKEHIVDSTLADLEESFVKEELKFIVLRPEIAGGSIGITLAGGTDYETKEITVHKVRNGSPAHRDGRLQKGDRILSINGKNMKGLTHADSIAVLKENVPEVAILACAGKEPVTPTLSQSSRNSSLLDLSSSTIKTADSIPNLKLNEKHVTLIKDSPSLGFSMEGGKDSLQGDVPLVIKKLFTGGTAEKSEQLQVGDELFEINGVDVSEMTRLDVWSLMKKLPDGEVSLKVRSEK